MGIGNAASSKASTRETPTHYPSWGSETEQLCELPNALNRCSLPLMGIGNLCAALAAACIDGPLISLPLMGIGNLEADVAAADTAMISLPLMGIGNKTRAIRLGGALLSLPLMGIGNAPRRTRPGTARLLITPHGDRKPYLDRI